MDVGVSYGSGRCAGELIVPGPKLRVPETPKPLTLLPLGRGLRPVGREPRSSELTKAGWLRCWRSRRKSSLRCQRVWFRGTEVQKPPRYQRMNPPTSIPPGRQDVKDEELQLWYGCPVRFLLRADAAKCSTRSRSQGLVIPRRLPPGRRGIFPFPEELERRRRGSLELEIREDPSYGLGVYTHRRRRSPPNGFQRGPRDPELQLLRRRPFVWFRWIAVGLGELGPDQQAAASPPAGCRRRHRPRMVRISAGGPSGRLGHHRARRRGDPRYGCDVDDPALTAASTM